MVSKIVTGVVVSDKMNNTVVVQIDRRMQHVLYKKFITRTKKLLADRNGIEVAVGDTVRIQETKPMSKNKYFKVIERVGA